MNKNIRIARELIKIAKSLIARFGSDYDTKQNYRIKKINESSTFITLTDNQYYGFTTNLKAK